MKIAGSLTLDLEFNLSNNLIFAKLHFQTKTRPLFPSKLNQIYINVLTEFIHDLPVVPYKLTAFKKSVYWSNYNNIIF